MNNRDLLNVYIISDFVFWLRISSRTYVDFRCWLFSAFCCSADVNAGQSLLAIMVDPDLVSRGRSGSAWLRPVSRGNRHFKSTCVTLNGSGIQLAVGPQPLWLRNHNFGLAQRIMVKRLAKSPHDPLDITDSACKNQLVVVRVQYGPFNTYIPIRSTTIGKSRVARDPIAMHTSWRSNSDIASVTSIGYPRMRASGESSTTKHRLLHASGPHPIPPPNDPKTMPPHRIREQQQDDDLPPPPPPPQLKPYERASASMLAGITRILERQSERSGKSHEEDVAETFSKQVPKDLPGLQIR
ncbi:carboxyl-terminal-processing peptidase 1, chloroplastic [Dorcoceras hygrometricum]|uniref:Carboxyl-terminal-processing peptidase 1, chloroplastic n=1 Tax=Dorcoceras hygrometricum TaxID=472368 RepID=A0A2Z7CQ21_9LAMI|nr:carboxyl-terminal-processing peptidase 1, chloroplastic [Dorcoceras hygrometricum]